MKTCPRALALLEWNPITPRNQLILDKSDSVHSRTKEYNNRDHTSKQKNSLDWADILHGFSWHVVLHLVKMSFNRNLEGITILLTRHCTNFVIYFLLTCGLPNLARILFLQGFGSLFWESPSSIRIFNGLQ
jgi:hypothetical protein